MHGFGAFAESFIGKRTRFFSSLPLPLRVLLTQSFLVLSSPLYIGLFLWAHPKWAEINHASGMISAELRDFSTASLPAPNHACL